jgi:hypothetical protein
MGGDRMPKLPRRSGNADWRKDLLAPYLESLIELLGGGKKTNDSSCAEPIEATQAACWGPMLVAGWLWRELGLESILDGLAPKTSGVQKAGRLPLADRVLVLVANRLCRPGSEHALAQWLESDFVCGRDGKRILAPWKQQGRVRVDLNWLQEWYRTLDQLLVRKWRNSPCELRRADSRKPKRSAKQQHAS